MLQQFMSEVLEDRPENIIDYAVDYFSKTEVVRERIKEYNPEAQKKLEEVFRTKIKDDK